MSLAKPIDARGPWVIRTSKYGSADSLYSVCSIGKHKSIVFQTGKSGLANKIGALVLLSLKDQQYRC